MYFGISIFLGAVGAILRFAVADRIDGVDLSTIGVILMIAGAIGLVISFLQLASRRRSYVVDRQIVDREVVPRQY